MLPSLLLAGRTGQPWRRREEAQPASVPRGDRGGDLDRSRWRSLYLGESDRQLGPRPADGGKFGPYCSSRIFLDSCYAPGGQKKAEKGQKKGTQLGTQLFVRLFRSIGWLTWTAAGSQRAERRPG